MENIKKWTQEQWSIATWLLFRKIASKNGSQDTYNQKDVKRWVNNYVSWLKEFSKGDMSDLKAIARIKIKNRK